MPENNAIDEINKLLNNCKISNMPDNKEKREFALQNLNFVEPFDGNINTLAIFIEHIDSIVSTISGLETEAKQLFFNAIQRKLVGPAADLLRRENPSDWRTLKSEIIEEFGEKKDISTQILELGNVKFVNSVKLFCETLNSVICKIKDCIKLSEETETRKNIYRLEVNRFGLEILRKNLPYHIAAILNANPVSDFKSALKILRESGLYFFEYKEKKFQKNRSIDHYTQEKKFQPISHIRGMPHYSDPFQCQTNTPQFCSPGQQYPNYQTGNFNQTNTNNYVPFDNSNLSRQTHFSGNKQVARGPGWNNSNQSRIRRYGAPVPMEQDDSNFHLHASENCRW